MYTMYTPVTPGYTLLLLYEMTCAHKIFGIVGSYVT